MGTHHWSHSGGTPTPDPDEGVLPAVVRERSDGTDRFICYDDEADPSDVDEQWFSVDADTPVSLREWR